MSPIIQSDNRNFQQFTVCFIESQVYPHKNVPVLIDYKIIQSYIDGILRMCGNDSVISKNYILYAKDHSSPFVNTSNPFDIPRIRHFEELGMYDKGRIIANKSINRLCLVISEVFVDEGIERFGINLNCAFNFGPHVPVDLHTMYVDYNKIQPVEPWLAEVMPEQKNHKLNFRNRDKDFFIIETDDVKQYAVKLDEEEAMVFNLHGKAKDLIKRKILIEPIVQYGFYDIDLVAILKEDLISSENENNILNFVDEFFGKSGTSTIPDIQDKPSIFMDQVYDSAELMLHPLTEMFDQLYCSINSEIIESIGEESSKTLRNNISKIFLNGLNIYDLNITKNSK